MFLGWINSYKSEVCMSKLGPLKNLVGTWEGTIGEDRAPSSSRGVENNKYREEIVFEETGLVDNHEQELYGLRYRTMAWEEGHDDPFHEENGYWLWDAKAKQVMKCFTLPRGIAVNAGGAAEPTDLKFSMSAKLGDNVFGICSNPFLDKEFQTVSFEVEVDIQDENNFSYYETTLLKIKGQEKLFEHIDKNIMKKVK